jgi:hypothetical protein
MEEKVLAAALQSRKAFDVVTKLEGEKTLTTLGKQVFKGIARYYKADDGATCADGQLVLEDMGRRHPAHREQFTRVFENLPKVSPANVVEFVKANVMEHISLEIRAALDKGDYEKASELMKQYTETETLGVEQAGSGKTYRIMHRVNANDLMAPFKEGSQFKFLPDQLNELLDGVLPGDHILIYAPVNVGKSCLSYNMAFGFCRQGKRVLYIPNEGPEERNYIRGLNRFSGLTRKQIESHPDEADKRAMGRGFDNFYMVQLYPGSVDDIVRLVEEIKPDVCIVDQVINLNIGTKEPSKTEKLEQVCYALRILYNKTKVLGVSVAQADEKAINKAVLEIKDVYYSNVGVQAQVDIMIGMGASKDMLATGERWIQVCKNKASGIHDGFRIRLNQQLSKLED